MAFDIGPKIGIEGEAEFKKALTDLNSSLKTMGTEMNAVTSEYDKNDKSAAKLSAQNDVLTKQIAAQESKCALLADQLEKARNAYGDGSAQAQKLEQQLNNATATLNGMNRQLDNNSAAMKKSKIDWDAFGETAKKAGEIAAKSIAAVATAAAAAATAIGKMTVDSAAAADEIITLSAQTGLSTEAIQKYQYAAELIDVPLETLTGSMAKMTKNMATASKGTGDAAAAFAALGVSVTDEHGAMRDNQTVFNEAINALGTMENETQRDAYAMQIFGKSAQDLNPLIKGGADALEDYGKRAEEAGLILNDEMLGGLGALDDQIQIFKSTLSASKNTFATAFAGPMTEGLSEVNGNIERLAKSFSEGGFSALAEELGTVMTDVLKLLNDNLPQILDFGMNLIMTLITGLVQMLPELVKSAGEIIRTVGTGIVTALPELMPAIVDTILAIVDGLIANIDLLVDASIQIIGALASGLVNALPQLIARVPELIIAIVKALIGGVGQIKDVGIQIVKGLWEGIKSMASWISAKVTNFFNGIISGVKNFLGIHSPSTVFAGIGGNMAAGIGVGFDKGMQGVAKDMQGAIPTADMSFVTRSSVQADSGSAQRIVSAAVSGMAATQGDGKPFVVNLTVSGRTLASVLIDPLHETAVQRGEAYA